MKHNYEERKENRRSYYEDQAAKNDQLSDKLYDQANKIASYIPPGQPILVGHHSEKSHRRDLDRIHNMHGQSIEAGKKADHYRGKIATIDSNNAISSDDPEAIQKVAKKIGELEQLQKFMKEVNKCVRKKDLPGFYNYPMLPRCYGKSSIRPISRVGLAFLPTS